MALTTAVEQEAQKRPEAVRLITHPGVGAITALAFVLIIGDPMRFPNDKKLSSYLGLVPAEDSSGERRRLGHISKRGNSLLRFLLVEAAQAAARSDPHWQRQFLRLARNGVPILNLCSPKEVHGVSCECVEERKTFDPQRRYTARFA